MGDYHLFPQARGSEGSKYPQLTTTVRLTRQSSESCKSILTVRVPSPELCHPDEINQIWSRVSQHSSYPGIQPTASSRLTATKGSCQQGRQAQSPLPPAQEYSYSAIPSERVTRRLSSTSTEASGDSSSVLTKRSATPDLLQELSHHLSQHSYNSSERKASYSTAPSPRASSTTASQRSYSTPRSSTSSQSTLAVDMDSILAPELCKQQKDLRVNMPAAQPIIRPTSSRSPSTRHNANTANLSLPNASRSEAMLCPPIPQEVSHMDWDDDDKQSGKLARMKKSIGDLRAATLRTKTESHVPTPKVDPKRTHQYSLPRSPRSARLDRSGTPGENDPRPIAARSQTYPAPIFAYPGYPPASPPPLGPLPPRPITRPAASAERIDQSLPPLPPCAPRMITAHVTLPPSTSTPPPSPSTESCQRTLSATSLSPSIAPTTRTSRPSIPYSVKSDASTLVAVAKSRTSRGSTTSTNNGEKQRRPSATGPHRTADPHVCTICGSTENECISTSQHLARHKLYPSTTPSPRTSIAQSDSHILCDCCGTSQAIRNRSVHHLDHCQHLQQPLLQKKRHTVRSVRRSRRVSSASAFSCMSSVSKTGKSSAKGVPGASVVGLRHWFRWAVTVAGLGRKGKKGRRRSLSVGCERPAVVQI